MTITYVETSALGRVLLDESDAPVVRAALERIDQPVTSRLTEIELRRVALKHGLAGLADPLLAHIALLPLADATLTLAGNVVPSNVATLDAIHLATAVRLHEAGDLDAMLTYDKRLADGAREHGIEVLSPGAPT